MERQGHSVQAIWRERESVETLEMWKVSRKPMSDIQKRKAYPWKRHLSPCPAPTLRELLQRFDPSLPLTPLTHLRTRLLALSLSIRLFLSAFLSFSLSLSLSLSFSIPLPHALCFWLSLPPSIRLFSFLFLSFSLRRAPSLASGTCHHQIPYSRNHLASRLLISTSLCDLAAAAAAALQTSASIPFFSFFVLAAHLFSSLSPAVRLVCLCPGHR